MNYNIKKEVKVMNKIQIVYKKIVKFIMENFKRKVSIIKSKKSYSLYIIVNNKKIRISEHTNNYPKNDLFINFIYSLNDSIYNILKEVEKNISKMLLTK